MLSHSRIPGITEREKKMRRKFSSTRMHATFFFFFFFRLVVGGMAYGRGSCEPGIHTLERPDRGAEIARLKRPKGTIRQNSHRRARSVALFNARRRRSMEWAELVPFPSSHHHRQRQRQQSISARPSSRPPRSPPGLRTPPPSATRWSTAPRAFLAGRAPWSQQPPPSSAAPPSHQIKHSPKLSATRLSFESASHPRHTAEALL